MSGISALGRWLCALIIVLMCSGALANENEARFEAGIAALERQHYATAIRAWQDLASSGNNSGAQNNLGYLFEYGLGVRQNFDIALEWYRKADERGSAEAAHNIGIMYVGGKGVPKSWSRAIPYFLKAQDRVPASRYMIALSYFEGNGHIQNRSQAYAGFLDSSLSGYGPAQYMTAFMLLDGRDIPRNVMQAYAWAKIASLGTFEIDALEDILLSTQAQLDRDELETAEAVVTKCTALDLGSCSRDLLAL